MSGAKGTVGPIRLSHVTTKQVQTRGPFSFRTTFRKPSHFPTPLEAAPDDSEYFVVSHVGADLVGCHAKSLSSDVVELRIYSPVEVDGDAAAVELARRFGLSIDTTGFAGLWSRDPSLRTLREDLAGGRPASPHSLYDFMMICIFLQNTQIRRTVQMMEAMLARFSRSAVFPEGVALPVMWRPEDVLGSSEEELRGLKVGYRARIIWRLSTQFADDPTLENRLLNLGAPDELDKALRDLYGVGPATAGYLCFEWFKFLDHLVHVSPWEAKILSRLVSPSDDMSPASLIDDCRRRWSPFTTLAAHALFESVFWKRAEGIGPAWLDELIRL